MAEEADGSASTSARASAKRARASSARTRKSAAKRARKAARRPATSARRTAGAVNGMGSDRLAESLGDLLGQASDELARANQLAAALSQGSNELTQLMDAYTATVQTLSQLYRAAPEGPLAQFWAEQLRPDVPQGIPELVAAANRAHRVRVV